MLVLHRRFEGLEIFDRSRGVAMLELEGLNSRRGTKIRETNAELNEGLYKL